MGKGIYTIDCTSANPHQQALIQAAHRLGIETVVERDPARDACDRVIYRIGERSVTIIDGCIYPGLTPQVDALCANKHRTKSVFRYCGIPSPHSIQVDRHAVTLQQEIEAFIADFSIGSQFVCKPTQGTNGEGVSMGLTDVESLITAIQRTAADTLVIEEQADGRDLRLQIIGDRIVAACIREPAYVIGDGQSSVQQLMAARDLFIQSQNPQNRLIVTDETLQLLEKAGMTLDDCPATGEKVSVKQVANIGQGGMAIDVTDTLHERFQIWVECLARNLPLDIFGLDLISPDPETDPLENNTVALEINAQPQWLHHTFSERRQHNIPKLILEYLLFS